MTHIRINPEQARQRRREHAEDSVRRFASMHADFRKVFNYGKRRGEHLESFIRQQRKAMILAVTSVADYDRNLSALHYRINARAELKPDVEKHATPDGFIWYQDGGRDCDMYESTSAPWKMRASVFAWERHIANLYEWAEGPVWFWLLKPEDVEHAAHGSRDLALEAFEDGHAHVVSHVRFDEEGSYHYDDDHGYNYDPEC